MQWLEANFKRVQMNNNSVYVDGRLFASVTIAYKVLSEKSNVIKVTTASGNVHYINTKYYVDYVYNNPSGENYYHQLVRSKDNCILYAKSNLDNICLFCWGNYIFKKDVTIL